MKKLIFILIAIAVIILAIFFAREREVSVTNYSSSGTDIIAFGDSLVTGIGSTQGGGFVKMLSDELRIPIVNLGIPGNTTTDALKRISQLDRYEPKVVMILLGGNDYLLRRPKEEILANMGKIIDEIHKRAAVALVLDLDDGFGSLAEEKKAAYISGLFKGIFGRKNLMSDGLHPNDAGYRLMADKIKPVLYKYKPPEIQSEEISISILPEQVEQGDPVLIIINGTTTPEYLKFNGKKLKTFIHDGKVTALTAVDLRSRTGSFSLELKFKDGRKIERKLSVGERYIAKLPLGIPEKLGGDTPEAEQELIKTLIQEGKLISAVPTANKKLWEGDFRLPLAGLVVVTDNYGYSRQTVGSTISHKGTDFRAKVGTPVYAMNSGVVRFTKYLRNYGHTVIIDHGLGLHTVYMHLSEINVPLNKEVKKGEFIAKSGDTGYVLGPHLHISVRIDDISIDPEKFMKILGE